MELLTVTIPLMLYDEHASDFIQACYDEELDLIEEYIEEDLNIAKKFPTGLELLCQKNNIEIIRFLVSRDYIDLQNENKSALIVSCFYGHLDLVKYLISVGANPIETNNFPITFASRGGHIDIVKYLTLLGADPYVDNNINLCAAITSNNPFVIKFFIMFGCDPSSNNDLLMGIYCQYGNLDMVGFLHRFGVALNYQQLFLATTNNHIDIMEYLIVNGVNIREENDSVVLVAIKFDRLNALKLLCDHLHLSKNDEIFLTELLIYAKNIKNIGMAEPTSCISFLKDLLKIEDEYPTDVIIDTFECPVCLEGSDLILPCRHLICKICIRSLLEKKCPVCRYPIDNNLVRKRKC